MAEIICPMCGYSNPDELDVCQFCEAQLKSTTDQLSRSQPPIKPGEDPSIVDTGELEPVLPQWLREIRQKAREAAEESQEPGQEAEAREEAIPEPQGEKEGEEETPIDLLAGLASQSEEDEEVPDWLANIREESNLGSDSPDMVADLQQDTDVPKTGELGGITSSAWDSGDGDTDEPFPDQDLPPDSGFDFPLPDSVSEESLTDAGALPDWLKEMGAESIPQEDELISAPFPSEETAEPISEEPAAPGMESDMYDWLAELSGEETSETEAGPADEEPAQFTEEGGGTPDWLARLDSDDTAQEKTGLPTEEPAHPVEDGDTTDWLFSLGEEEAAGAGTTPEPEQTSQPSQKEGEIPDWLSSLGEETPEGTETTPEPEEPAPPSQEEGEKPDWLSSTGEQETAAAETTPEPEEPDLIESSGREGQAEEFDAEPVEPPFSEKVQKATSEEEGAADFVPDSGTPISSGDMDDIFSMEMPDWLEDVGGQEKSIDAEADEGAAISEDLSPASLPNWVQAMRPVESVLSETPDSDEIQDIEESGPFAGLAGVLPPMPDFSPSSKPKTYTLKLAANEEQQENAALLERLLASEAHPLPIKSHKQMLSQRILRWLISMFMLILISGVMFSGTQIIPMPLGMPLETWAAVQAVEGIPENAPVLLIFDYEAARAGEMEVAAAGLIDHMLLLKHPRLALLASNPTGAGLAGRFMSITQSGHKYQDGQQMLNLGYLPGGAAGVLGFANNPQGTMPLAANGSPAWQSPALQGVNGISDFATVILLSDDAESARMWIEQLEAEHSLGDTSFIVVSSGQSGPMILPYVQSGQVDGMVMGLDNNASIEQYNAGRPGLARGYWDAYGFGLLAAVAIIILGSLWNLIPALRARRADNTGEG